MLHGKCCESEICLLYSDFVCCMENFSKSYLEQPKFQANKIIHASCENFWKVSSTLQNYVTLQCKVDQGSFEQFNDILHFVVWIIIFSAFVPKLYPGVLSIYLSIYLSATFCVYHRKKLFSVLNIKFIWIFPLTIAITVKKFLRDFEFIERGITVIGTKAQKVLLVRSVVMAFHVSDFRVGFWKSREDFILDSHDATP